jgi:hypothetical protein
MKRDGPKAPAAIRCPFGFALHPLQKANAFANCLEKHFTSHELCDENHKRRVEARAQALQKLVHSLKIRKACEIDGIPNECLRHLLIGPLVHLTHLFNHCLRISHFPTPWKDAKILTLPKPGKDNTSPQNLRPISLLHTTGKLFQKVILKIVQRHVVERDLLNANQFGFRASHSTLQSMRLTDHVTPNLKNNMSTAAVFLNIQKAFDTTWHSSLLYKLSKLDFPVSLIKLLISFHYKRKFFVSVEGEISTPRIM